MTSLTGIALPLAAWSLELLPVLIPKWANTLWVNPEQSAPLVRLVPPYTYGLPRNCLAYATTAFLVADATSEEGLPPLPGPLDWLPSVSFLVVGAATVTSFPFSGLAAMVWITGSVGLFSSFFGAAVVGASVVFSAFVEAAVVFFSDSFFLASSRAFRAFSASSLRLAS